MLRTFALLAALASVPAFADDDDRWSDRDRDRRPYGWNDRYRDRDGDRDRRGRAYGRNDREYGRDQRNVRGRGRGDARNQNLSAVNRTVSDLRRAQARNRYDNEKREHFERAFYHLGRFESEWRRSGRFHEDSLSDAIERINKLANSDQISSRDRDALRRDLSDLRALRSGGGSRYSYIR